MFLHSCQVDKSSYTKNVATLVLVITTKIVVVLWINKNVYQIAIC